MVSGYPRDAQVHGGSRSGDWVFFEKHFRRAQLADAIASAFNGGASGEGQSDRQDEAATIVRSNDAPMATALYLSRVQGRPPVAAFF